MYVYLYMCVYICSCICICMYMYICLCVCVCVCLYLLREKRWSSHHPTVLAVEYEAEKSCPRIGRADLPVAENFTRKK